MFALTLYISKCYRTVPVTILVIVLFFSATAIAEVYITADEAVRNIFPGLERYEEKIHQLGSQQAKVFTVFKNDEIAGWAVALDEMGKIKPITFLVGIDIQHRVLAVYILEYRDLFGADIKRKSFLRQFIGKTSKDALRLGRDIDAVTSATVSSKAATAAVKKALKITEGL